jgi:hypothetical protein
MIRRLIFRLYPTAWLPRSYLFFMNSLYRWLLYFCLSLCSGNLLAQETFFRRIYEPKSGSYVEVVSLFSKLPSSGFAPVRVTIANRTDVPASVSLLFQSESGSGYGSGALKTKSSFVASSPKGTVTSSDFLVPVAAVVKDSGHSYNHNSQTLELTMVGVTAGSYIQSSTGKFGLPSLLISEALSTPNASSLDSEVNAAISGSSGGYSPGNLVFGGKFNPAQMPEDWRAYIGYDGLLLTDLDWGNLSPGARSAILQWNRNGGFLGIFSSNSVTSLATLSITTDVDANPAPRGKGYVQLNRIAPALTLDAKTLVNECLKGNPGPTRQAEAISTEYSSASWGLQNQLGTKTFHFVMFILVLIAFGILVGPINLFVFAKSGMRHKLFITTPIIALGASAVMIVLIFLQDGLGGRGLRVQWIELVRSDGDNNAYIYQEQISRSGVLVGNRFLLTDPTAISPIPLAPSQWTRLNPASNNDQSYEMNFTDTGLQVSGDWFQSRSEQAQMLKAIIPSRARIESSDAANEAALLSNFEYEIADFYLRGKGGKFWRAQQIASGKNFLASECSQAEFEQFVSDCVTLLGKSQQEKIRQLSEREGCYIASSSKAPMLETYSAIKWSNDTTIITGRVQKSEAP